MHCISALRFGSAKIRRKQSHFKEQVFAFCSFLPIAMHSLFRFLAPLSVSACKDTTSAISASGYERLRQVSQEQMRINPLFVPYPNSNWQIVQCPIAKSSAKIRQQKTASSVFCRFLQFPSGFFLIFQFSSVSFRFLLYRILLLNDK